MMSGRVTEEPPFDLTRRGERQASSVSPIYTRTSDGQIQGVGTGIFFAHGRHAFVVTASHVLTQYINTDELLIGGKSVIRLNQRFFPSVDEDAYDVGFVPLTDDQRAALSDVRFLTRDDVELTDDLPQDLYYVVGYRSDDNAPEGAPTQVIAGWSVYAARSASADAYEKRRLSQVDRLLLMFDRTRLYGADGPVETEPEPEGLSGSGVWRLTSDPATDRPTAIIEAHTDSGKLIYAARFGILIRGFAEFAEGRLA